MELLSAAGVQENRHGRHPVAKEEAKLSLFAHGLWVYTGNPAHSKNNLLDPRSEYRKTAGHAVDTEQWRAALL